MISNLSANDYILDEWRVCESVNDCQITMDLGCKNQCKSDVINPKFKKPLSDKINSDCADLLVPPVACARDIRPKIVRCIKNKCQLMTKHICCTLKTEKLKKSYNCHIKDLSCTETLFNK